MNRVPLGAHVYGNGRWVGVRTCIMDFGAGRLSIVILSNRNDFDSAALANKVAKIYLKR